MVKIKKYIVRASVKFPLLDGHELLPVYEYIPNGTVQQGQYKKIELTDLINSWVEVSVFIFNQLMLLIIFIWNMQHAFASFFCSIDIWN